MKISILNLAPLRQGQNFKDAIDAMVKFNTTKTNIEVPY